eukprot:1157921-Pelagomonas_calceolata.AAC.2
MLRTSGARLGLALAACKIHQVQFAHTDVALALCTDKEVARVRLGCAKEVAKMWLCAEPCVALTLCINKDAARRWQGRGSVHRHGCGTRSVHRQREAGKKWLCAQAQIWNRGGKRMLLCAETWMQPSLCAQTWAWHGGGRDVAVCTQMWHALYAQASTSREASNSSQDAEVAEAGSLFQSQSRGMTLRHLLRALSFRKQSLNFWIRVVQDRGYSWLAQSCLVIRHLDPSSPRQAVHCRGHPHLLQHSCPCPRW